MARLRGLHAGARYGNPVFVVRDLDQDAPCAGAMVAGLVPEPHRRFVFRVCVREAEAWLMADATAYATYCGLPFGKLPSRPEEIDDPKLLLRSWAERGIAKRLARVAAA
jgi:hypothetical protein